MSKSVTSSAPSSKDKPETKRGNSPSSLGSKRGIKLSLKEARQMVVIWDLPPFLTLDRAAEIANLKPSSLRNKASEGSFPKSAVRGKPLMFVTIFFLQELALRMEVSL